MVRGISRKPTMPASSVFLLVLLGWRLHEIQQLHGEGDVFPLSTNCPPSLGSKEGCPGVSVRMFSARPLGKIFVKSSGLLDLPHGSEVATGS